MSEQIIFPNHSKNEEFTSKNKQVKESVVSLNTLTNNLQTRLAVLEASSGTGGNIDGANVNIDDPNFEATNVDEFVSEVADYTKFPFPPGVSPGTTFTVHVNSVSGSNSNNGLTSGKAVADIFVAINQIVAQYRVSDVDIVFKLFGTFDAGVFTYAAPDGTISSTSQTSQVNFRERLVGKPRSIKFQGSTPTNPRATLINSTSTTPVQLDGDGTNISNVPITFDSLTFRNSGGSLDDKYANFRDNINVTLTNVCLDGIGLNLTDGSTLTPGTRGENPGKSIVCSGTLPGDFLILQRNSEFIHANPDFYIDDTNPLVCRDFIRAVDSVVGNISQITNSNLITINGSTVNLTRSVADVDDQLPGMVGASPNVIDDLSIFNGENYDGTGTAYLTAAGTTREALNTLDAELDALNTTVTELIPTDKIIISTGSVSVYINQTSGGDESVDPENILTPLASITAAKSYVADKYLFSGSNTILNFFLTGDYDFSGEEVMDGGEFINGSCTFVLASSDSSTPIKVSNVATSQATFRNIIGTLEFDSIEWDCKLKIQDCHSVKFVGNDTFDQEVSVENAEFTGWLGNPIFNDDLIIRDSRRVQVINPTFNALANVRINSCQEVDLSQMVMNQNENNACVQVSNCFGVAISDLTLSNEVLSINSDAIFELDGISNLQLSGTFTFNATSLELNRTLFQISNSVIAGSSATWVKGAGVTSAINVLNNIDVCNLKSVSSRADWVTTTPVMFAGSGGNSAFIRLETGSSWDGGITLQPIDNDFWQGFDDPISFDDTSSFRGYNYDSPQSQTLGVSNLKDATDILIDRSESYLSYDSQTVPLAGDYLVTQTSATHLEIEVTESGVKVINFDNVNEDDRIFLIKNSPNSLGDLEIKGRRIYPGHFGYVHVDSSNLITTLYGIFVDREQQRVASTTALVNGGTASPGILNPVDVVASPATINPPPTIDLVPGISWFSVVDALENASSNGITIDFVTAGQKLHGTSTNFILDTNLAHAKFVYINATIGWVLS